MQGADRHLRTSASSADLPALLATIAVVLAMILAGCASTPPPAPAGGAAKPEAPKQEAPKPAESKPAPTASKPAAAPAAAAPTAAPAAKPAVQPVQGGELVIGMVQEAASLDPSNGNLMAMRPIMAIYDTLVVMNPDFTFSPALAESWQVSADNKSYTFKLKSGVKFHDGTPFNAEALKGALDWTTRKDAKGNFTVSINEVYDRTEVIDNLTARVVLKEPYAPFLDAISEGYYSISSPTAIKKFGKDYDRNPVGTGPFVFVEWMTNDHITVRKNPDYNWAAGNTAHKGPAHVDKITFKLIPEPGTRLATLETGETHVIEEPDLQELANILKNPKFGTIQGKYPGMPRIFRTNVERPPTNELAVRQAMLWAIDQEAIMRVVYFDHYKASHNIFVPGTFGYDEEADKMYRYDPAKAKALLEEAGWKMGSGGIRQKDGKPLKMNVYAIAGVWPNEQISQLVQAQLREVGIDFEIVNVARTAWTEGIARGDHNTMIGMRTSSDPDSVRLWVHSSTIGRGNVNAIRLRDPQFDALLEKGYQILDPKERIKAYAEIQRYIMKNALVIPIAHRENVQVFNKRVQGLSMDLRAYPRYYDVWMTK